MEWSRERDEEEKMNAENGIEKRDGNEGITSNRKRWFQMEM